MARPYRRWTIQDRKTLIELRSQGLTAGMIAIRMGREMKHVCDAMIRFGINIKVTRHGKLATENFVTKVECGVKLPDQQTLIKCRTGLTSRMRKEKGERKARLRMIRDEIDYLINAL